jgi:hypothetical protein
MGNKLPVNRIVAFAGPYIAVVSGALADWLLVHVHFLGIFHTTKTSIASMLTQGLVFALTSILVWAGHHKWLTGWQQFEATVAGEGTNGPDVHPDDLPAGDYDPTVAGGDSEPVPGAEVPPELPDVSQPPDLPIPPGEPVPPTSEERPRRP